MSDRSHIKGKGRDPIDKRDPVDIAGDEGRYSDLQYAADTDAHVNRTGSLRKASDGLKRRIGSLRGKGPKELKNDLNDFIGDHI